MPEFYDGKFSAGEAEAVTVNDSSTTFGVNAELVERQSAGAIVGGTVSNTSHQPIAGIEACAYSVAGEETGLFGLCTTTEAQGHYLITGLPSGEYLVEFSSPSESGLDYVAQYYDDAASPEKATAVTVGSEAVDTAVNAEMHEGGYIAGQATDALTGAPIKGISVCAYAEQEETGACATTGQNGQYTIAGLPVGEYAVEFSVSPESALDYVRRYFDEQGSAKNATLVPVAVGATSSGVNARLQVGGRVTGRVRSLGGPLANVLVCALTPVKRSPARRPIATANTR